MTAFLKGASETRDTVPFCKGRVSQENVSFLAQQQEALKCYWKAYKVGDIEGGIALFQLARMYDSADESEQVKDSLMACTKEIRVTGCQMKMSLPGPIRSSRDFSRTTLNFTTLALIRPEITGTIT